MIQRKPRAPSFGLGDLRHHPWLDRARAIGRRLGLWAVGHFLEEAVHSLWRARAWNLFAVGIIAFSLATVGAFMLVAENLRGLVQRMGSLEVSVYIRDDASVSERTALRKAIEAVPEVEHLREVSKEEALSDFRRSSPDLASVPDALGENPFPASFEVTLAREARAPETLRAFAARMQKIAGVDSVSQDLELAERVLAASRLAKMIAAGLGSVLLLSALFTVSNVVKLTVYTRRDEIEILRLVGATGAYVRGTFVTEGILQGLAGSLLALALLYGFYRTAGGWLASSGLALLAALATHFLSFPSQALLVLAGAGLGAIGSLIPLRRLI